MAANVNQPDSTSNTVNTRSFVDQPIPAGYDSTGNNANPNTTGSTSNATKRNKGTGGHTTRKNPTVARPVPASTSSTSLNLKRSQVQSSPSRPISFLERRPTGPGLNTYDPIRGESTPQVYLPDASGEGDPPGVSNRPGNRNTVGVLRPGLALGLTDETAVGNGEGPGPGLRRASWLMSGQDWEPEAPPPPVSTFSSSHSLI